MRSIQKHQLQRSRRIVAQPASMIAAKNLEHMHENSAILLGMPTSAQTGSQVHCDLLEKMAAPSTGSATTIAVLQSSLSHLSDMLDNSSALSNNRPDLAVGDQHARYRFRPSVRLCAATTTTAAAAATAHRN